jgi:hypothetical protein
MPYRRLPNTDQARIRALRAALKMEERVGFNNHILSFKIVLDAKNFLSQYEVQQAIYHQSLENQVNANKKYQRMISNARMYISHFIQVFNMAVVRGEIKQEHTKLYGLETYHNTVPDLSTEQAVLEWGKKIIEGEALRVGQGGLPIYNPTIAKVQVHYDVFREYKASQKMYQQTTSRKWEEMIALRKQGDELIVQLWNEIEEHFKNLKPYARLMKCVEYGIIYYYRKGEKELTPESDQE